ncbi:MAG: hypothetical protein IJY80_01840, partial [Opitutales bacterium]|nr:hypothetical protein [Opitutales bacterium]
MTIRKSCIASLFATTCAALALSAFTASAAVTQSDVDLKSGVWPVMVRMEYNPILQIKVSPSKSAKPDKLEAVKIDFSKTTNLNEVEAVDVYVGGSDVKAGDLFGTAKLSKA